MDDNAFANYGSGGPAVGVCFSTLTGVMDLDTVNELRTINPRSTTDMPTTTCTF